MKNLKKVKLGLIVFLFSISMQTWSFAQEKSKWALVSHDALGVGSVAPEVSFKDQQGKTVKLSDYKGKIVLLDVWASWCKPCIEGMPGMNEVYKQNKDEVVMLAVCSADKLDNFNMFIKKNAGKYDFTYLFDPNGLNPQSADFRALYGINGFPTTMVIDQKGVVAGYGYAHDDTISDHEKVEQLIKKLRVKPKKA